jgi:hypothetical protein
MKIQEEMFVLRQMMEATRIVNTQQPTTSTIELVEARPIVSHALEVMRERRVIKLVPGVIAFS